MIALDSALYQLGPDALRIAGAPAFWGIGVWVLAIVFAWSGIVKLRRPALAAMAIVDFGVLRRVRPTLGSALGAAELFLALVLATGALPVLSLPVAAGLLWLFVVLIAKSLWSGERFACFCFGDADSKLSQLTLVRTAALAILASVLLVAALLPPPMHGGIGGGGYGGAYALLQAAAAMALVGTIVLGGQLPKLLRLGKKDPHTTTNAEVNW
jgi:hypothetical protein